MENGALQPIQCGTDGDSSANKGGLSDHILTTASVRDTVDAGKRRSKYARNPDYGQPVKWAAEYRKHFPEHTDGCSRHVKMIAHECLRDVNSYVRRLLIDAGYEPDHWAQSMEITVKALWEARAEIERLTPTKQEEPAHDRPQGSQAHPAAIAQNARRHDRRGDIQGRAVFGNLGGDASWRTGEPPMTDQDLEDLLSDTLAESFYTHWNERDGAKALVPILRQLFVPRVEGVVPTGWRYERANGTAIKLLQGAPGPEPDWTEAPLYPESVVASLQAQLAEANERCTTMAESRRLAVQDLGDVEAQLASVGALIDQFRFDSDEDVFRLIDAINAALGADQ